MERWLLSESRHFKSTRVSVESHTNTRPHTADISKCQRCGSDPEEFKHELHPYDTHWRCLFCESCACKLFIDATGTVRAHDFACPCCGELVRRVYDLRAPEKPFWFSVENGPFSSSPPATNAAPFRMGDSVSPT